MSSFRVFEFETFISNLRFLHFQVPIPRFGNPFWTVPETAFRLSAFESMQDGPWDWISVATILCGPSRNITNEMPTVQAVFLY